MIEMSGLLYVLCCMTISSDVISAQKPVYGKEHICNDNVTEKAGWSGTIAIQAGCKLTLTYIGSILSVPGIRRRALQSCALQSQTLTIDAKTYCPDKSVTDTIIKKSNSEVLITSPQRKTGKPLIIHYYKGEYTSNITLLKL